MERGRFKAMSLPDPRFAGDTGDVAPAVAAALASYADDPVDSSRYAGALAALRVSRLRTG